MLKKLKKYYFPIMAALLGIMIIFNQLPAYLFGRRKKKKINAPINILFVIASLNVGGTEVQLKNLLKYLDRKKINPTLCVLTETGPLASEINALDLPIIILKKRTGINFSIALDIKKLIKKYKIDVVHTSLFASNFWGRIGALLGGAKIIIASERSAAKEKNYILFDKILSYFTDIIICNSKAVKRFQIEKEKINPKKLEIIYNGVDLQKFDENLSQAQKNRLTYRYKLGIQNDEFVIGNVCRITPEKDLLTWLKTAKLIIDTLKTADISQNTAETSVQFREISARFRALPRNIKFIIVGDAVSAIGEETGYKKQVVDLINELGIKNNVIMTGFSDNVTKELAIMDLFYQSSVIEGFPNSVMEALAASLPVVATPAGGTEEMITDNENGIIVPMGKPEETTEIIIDLINDPDKMRIMGDNARLTIKNNFSGETLARNTEKLYEQLLSR